MLIECSIPENHREREERSLVLMGWYTHVIYDDSVTGFNMHTHGAPDNFHMPDLQVVAPVDVSGMHDLMHKILRACRFEGRRYRPYSSEKGLLDYGSIMFVPAEENGRYVWRIILPDSRGRLRKLEPPWSLQWDGVIPKEEKIFVPGERQHYE